MLLGKPYRKDDLARKLRSMLDEKKEPDRPAPIVQTRAGSAPAKAESRTVHSGPRKVLVVEDVVLIRMTTVDMVTELGYTTLEAGSGPEALDLLAKNPDIDVLFTDLGLPGMTGAALVQRARALRPDIAVIIASGYSSQARPGDELPPDAHYLPKPFDLPQIQRVFDAL